MKKIKPEKAANYVKQIINKHWLIRFKDFLIYYAKGIYKRTDQHHIFLLSGGLAFSIFVCIIPLILILFSILGSFLDSVDIQYQVNILVDTIIPYSTYSEYVKEIIYSRIDEVVEYRTIAGVVGVFGLLFAASSLFSSMRTILNTVLNINVNINILLEKLWDFALVLMIIIIFFITTISMPLLDVLKQNTARFKLFQFLQTGIFEHFLFSTLSFVLILIVFLVLYVAVPMRKLGKKATFVSAIWAAIFWEAAKQLFGYYIYNYANFGEIYGTYALIVVVAFWIYYSSMVFIMGAEIGRLYYERNFVNIQD